MAREVVPATAAVPTPSVDALAELTRVLPGLSLLPPRRRRAPRHGLRRRPATAARPDRDVRRPRAGAGRPGAPGGAALPADQRRGDGQGGGGLRVLPDLPAHLADRGGWRPERVVGHGRRVPRGDGRAAARAAAGDDDHVDARHQARRGRAGPDRRSRRDPGPLGRRPRHPALARPSSRSRRSATCSGRRSSAPGRRRASASTGTPRRRCARPATGRRGPRPMRRTRARCTRPSTPRSTTRTSRRSSTTCSSTSRVRAGATACRPSWWR